MCFIAHWVEMDLVPFSVQLNPVLPSAIHFTMAAVNVKLCLAGRCQSCK